MGLICAPLAPVAPVPARIAQGRESRVCVLVCELVCERACATRSHTSTCTTRTPLRMHTQVQAPQA
jgi:hypothetical protein